ncbi:hypothetical protein GCM10022396_13400 [Flavivirga amylovorans]
MIPNDKRIAMIDQDSKVRQTLNDLPHDELTDFLTVKQNTLSYNYISTRKFYKKENSLILSYRYPHLDENYNPIFSNFNSYIKNTYLKTENSIQKVLDNDNLSCDPLFIDAERNRRNIDYKIYTKNNQFLSILLHKANYYDHTDHNSFMFKGLNYDVKTGTFITYKDIFKNNSDTFLLSKLNKELQTRIEEQDSFIDCWELTQDKFEVFKNNFVINSKYIKFYFDDCTICPTYSGNYFLEMQIEELYPILTEKSKMLF